MFELGKYTQSILIAYGVSLTLLVGLIWQSLARNARARRALKQQEGNRDAR
ncbi:heme exporter protein CcmD [Paracoccus xiamenensis]|uniref:heme exporter protein CcmD n=1 Tax=Paracoccus xiamenensis TaxID=2714901 RepID=UPI001F187D63|nr:heme exporter protein CcmD [Paracoccus xiamenensis]